MTDDKSKLLLFDVGDRQYALDLLCVRSITSETDLPIPSYHLASILTEGREDSDCKKASDPEADKDQNPCKLVVLNVRDQPFGVRVDRINGVISVDTSQIVPLSPVFRGPSMSCFPQVLKREQSLVLLLNPEGIEKLVREPSPRPLLSGNLEGGETGAADAACVPDISPIKDLSDTCPRHPPTSLIGGRRGQASGMGETSSQDGIRGVDDIPASEALTESRLPSLNRDDEKACPRHLLSGDSSFSLHPSALIEIVGSEMALSSLSAETLSQTSGFVEDADPGRLENRLTHMLCEERFSEMIIQIFTRQLEETVAQKMGKVKKVVLEKLLEVRRET